MRLQVEIATASWTSASLGELAARNSRRLAVGQREALAQRDRRGLVRDAEGEQLAHRTASAPGLGGRLLARARRRRAVGELVELGQLALDAAERTAMIAT